jgi:serine/threonine protein kinase
VERQGFPDPRIGAVVAGYRIDAAIGRGGMGRVYRAEHLRLGRPVALKLLGTELAEDPLFRARFEREWRLAASLRHPHIIPIYDAGEEDGILYIAMLLVEGGDLSLLLRHRGAMDPERALNLLAQVASALDAAHGQNLIHRDLKPSNILLATGRAAEGDDHAYLADFGLTKSVASSSQLTLTGLYIGTPSYSSPEQIAGHALDRRADVYALACLLFECLTGSLPYPRDSEMAAIAAHLTEPPPSARALRPGLPAGIDAVLARGLAKSAEERYPTAPELIDAARAVLTYYSAPTLAIAPEPPPTVAVSPEPPSTPAPSPPDLSSDFADMATRFDPPTYEAAADRRRPRARRRRPFGDRVALLLIFVAVPVILGGAILAGILARQQGTATGPSRGTATASAPVPSSSASPLASPSANPSFAGATADERFLIDRVPAAIAPACNRYEARSSDVPVQGSVAGLICEVEDPDVEEALYFRFTSSDSLQQWWQGRIREAKLQPDSGGCAGGRLGETSYEGGRLLCFASTSKTSLGDGRLRWLDEGALMYGVINARTDRLPAIVQWWLEAHAARGVRAEPLFLPIEQQLLADAPPDTADVCIPYRLAAKGETVVEGSVGAIDCLVDNALVEDVGYYEFPTQVLLDAWWRDRITRQKIEPDSGGCVDGTPGETAWAHGRIACYRSGGAARIRWTDDRRLVYGALNGVTNNLASLFNWWDKRH